VRPTNAHGHDRAPVSPLDRSGRPCDGMFPAAQKRQAFNTSAENTVFSMDSKTNLPGNRQPSRLGLPPKQGLYDPQFEHDACGVGFVVDMHGRKSHKILRQAIQVLVNLDHRGACGAETNTGDGAGILLQMPHKFFQIECEKEGITLPAPGEYGCGLVFMPRDATLRRRIEERFGDIVESEGQVLLGWRTVPTDHSMLGETARASEPFMRQVFIGRGADITSDLEFERKLYVIRKHAYNDIRASTLDGADYWYMCSLSYKTLVYKGMLLTLQLDQYFPDLRNETMETALGLVHSRFSTNTFPSWDRAHPYRYVAHNGEINTLRGNQNWMNAREALFKSDVFGDDINKILPVANPNGSDSAIFDNVMELLVLGGRSLPHAVMMMIPEPWSGHAAMDETRRAFYQYHSSLMEPWDGPACVAFTDGVKMGAILDRNGLRPARYYVTKDGLVVMASEAGVLSDIPPEDVIRKGRLQPGRMFLVDTEQGRIIEDEEIKQQIISDKPYKQWLDQYLVKIESLPAVPEIPAPDHDTLLQRQSAFGYTFEDQRLLMTPMARDGVEAIGSMGNDTPLAALSSKSRLLFDYFKQLFAQVTNPPIDCIREELITASEVWLGAEGDLLDPQPADCRRLELKAPILTNEEFAQIRNLNLAGLRVGFLSSLFPAAKGEKGLNQAIEDLWEGARKLIEEDGVNILILSDRGVDKDNAPIPSLLAVSSLHHYLIREGLRMRVSLVLESGDPREVHHFSLLIGYGASAINPYLAFETIDGMIRDGLLPNVDHKKACKNFAKAATKGVIKVMSKMGVSAVQSYHGAQLFEAVGLRQDFIDKHFTATASRIGGIGLDTVAKEVLMRHQGAFPDRPVDGQSLPAGGLYQWRADGEHHLFNPESIHRLQKAVRTENYDTYKSYAELIDNQSSKLCTLRGLLEFKPGKSIPIEEVEPIEAIMRRFKTGAMSYGSISKEAHETLAIAMNRVGGKSNTGEGGEDAERFVPMPNGDSKNSAIKQVASGRFGVTSHYLVNAQEIQIKMAQGAKPGEGGQLPGTKVYPWIAKTRGTTAGVGLISPPPHHDIYSIEDLAELIHDLKNANRDARISVKLVAEVGVGTIAAGVAKAHADVVLISGYDGGTGASPMTSLAHAGLPWELGLAETHQTLVLNNLRSRIAVEADGQLKTGRDVIVAALLGAEEFGFATAPLVAVGCIMMRVCHLNTCPVGIATQNPKLRERFTGKPEHAVNFMRFIAQDMREYMAKLGFRTLEEMIGRVDRLEPRKAIAHWKTKGFDLSNILYRPDVGAEVGRYCQISQDHGLDKSLDMTVLLDLCKPAIERGEKVRAELPIRNINRVVGTITGSEISKKWGVQGLPEDSIQIKFTGSAGQSFGAFMPKGMSFEIEGDVNDYCGKGLSGGKIIVRPSPKASFVPAENIIVGNVALYGATAGEAYFGGMAGERFAVRNSGVDTVVESVGDHGCEYMTGGHVVVLGPTGRNFGAGMSGGVAYVLDDPDHFITNVNKQMVGIESVTEPAEAARLRGMIEKHLQYTGSARAREVLANWEANLARFVKVIPKDYQRMLACIKKAHERGLAGDEAIMEAFEENARDLSRVGGN
jgi:glutamate synthase domain-containing protein 2/glutamate synthase domain-containing protein 1/glutamate synthase domain-containing protein 3